VTADGVKGFLNVYPFFCTVDKKRKVGGGQFHENEEARKKKKPRLHEERI